MRPPFESYLKTNEIPYKTIYNGHLTLGREAIWQKYAGHIGVSWRILAAGPVRRGIRDGEVGGKSTVGNLIIVIGVAPTPNAASGIFIPESAVYEV